MNNRVSMYVYKSRSTNPNTQNLKISHFLSIFGKKIKFSLKNCNLPHRFYSRGMPPGNFLSASHLFS